MVRTFASRWVVVFLLLAAAAPLSAVTFTSSQNGNWSSSATWGGAGVPVAGDTAVVNHTVTLDVPVTVGTVTLAGTLTGTQPITTTAAFNWNGGTMSGASTTTIPSGAVMTLGGYGTLDARTLSIGGTLNITSNYYISAQNGAAITNSGTINFQADGGIYLSSGATSITNSGTIEKTGGTGTTGITVPLTAQSGSQFLVQSGTFTLAAVTSTGGTFNTSSGATLYLSSSDTRTFDSASTISGAGTVFWGAGTNTVSANYNVTGVTKNSATATTISSITSTGDLVVAAGTLTLNSASAISVADLSMQSGNLAGTAPITLTGATQTWTGGTIGGSGLLTIPNGTSVAVNGYVYFDTRPITNAGTMTYSSNYYSYLYNGLTFTNSGTVDFQGDGGFYIGSGTPSVINSGTIKKSAGSGSGGLQVALTAQSGSQVQVQSGSLLFGNVTSTGSTLSVSSGATAYFNYTTASSFDAASAITGAGTVQFGAGTNSISAAYNITGATVSSGGATTIGTNNVTALGNVTASGGTLTVNNSSAPGIGNLTVSGGTLTLNIGSTLNIPTLSMQSGTLAGTAPITLTGVTQTWTGGTIAGSGLLTIPNGTTVAFNGYVYFDTRAITNAGTMTYGSNYYSYFYNGATLTNSGTVDFQGDGGFYIASGTPSVTNSGTIKKSAGTGLGAIQVSLIAQSGSQLQVQSGTLLLGNVTSTGSTLSVSSGATANFSYTATSSFDAASSITGAGTVQFTAGTNTVNAAYNISGGTKSSGGTTTLNSISSLGALAVNAGTLTLNGASAITVPTLTMQSGTLDGTLPISISGSAMTWSGGTIGGSGSLTIPNTTTITVTSVIIDGRPVSNAGTMNFTASGTAYLQNNAVLTNSGTIDIQSDGNIYLNGGASTAIVSSGTIKKSGGASGSSLNVPLTLQSGAQLQAQSSILYLGNVTATGATLSVSSGATAYFYYTTTASFDAASTISGAGTVQWGAGTNTVSGSYNITGATKSSGGATTISSIAGVGDVTMTSGTLTLNSAVGSISVPTLTMQGGTLNGTAPINLTGAAMTWSGGTIGGSGTLTIPITTTITVSGIPFLDARPVTNAGTINVTATNYFYMGNNAVLTNSGTIDFQGDSAIFQNGVVGTTAVVDSGTMKKSAGTGSGSTLNVPLTLQSGGQLLIQSGILYLGNVAATGATLNVSSGATAYFYYTSTASFDAASTISGAGVVLWGAGTNTVTGTYNITGATKSSGGATTIGTNITSTGDILMTGGTLTLNKGTALSVATLTMQGGTLDGTAPITLTGTAMTWTGGTIGGSGTLTVPNTATITISGNPFLDARPMANAGTMNFTGSNYLYLQNNAVLTNSGTINFQTDGSIYQSGAIGTTAVVNSGTIQKSGGTTSTFSVPLTLQSGSQFLIQSGLVYFGNITSTGATLNISSGATAYFYYTTTATFDAASTISGAGTLQNAAGTNSIAGALSASVTMSGGALSLNSAGTQTLPVLTMNGGTLNGSANINVTGAAMTWSGGAISGSGTLSIPAGTVITISGVPVLDARAVNNAGTMNLTASNYIYLQNNAVLNNSGTIDIQGDGGVYLNGVAGTTSVVDSGTIRKSAGTTGTFNVPLTLQSGGQFLIQSGLLYLGNIASTGGTLNISSGATGYLYYTTAATFDSASTISGSGTLQSGAGTNSISGAISTSLIVSGGTLSINSATAQSIPVLTMQAGTLNGTANLGVTAAAMTWSGGTIGGSGTLSIPGGTTVTIGGVPFLDGRPVTNGGTIAFTSTNYMYLQNGAVLTNNGTIDFQGDGAIYLNTGAASITNNGLLTKSAGTGTSNILATTNGVAGTIKPVSGTMAFTSLSEAGTMFFPVAGASAFGKVNVSGAFALGGTLTATTTSGYTPVNGTTFQVLTYGSSSGGFATKNLTYAGGGQFTDSYTSTAMTLTAGNAACTALPSNAVAWYRAEGNAADSAGTNPGTLSGGVTYATGENGQGFSFDGVNGSVNVPMSASLQLTNVTIEFWMKGDPANPLTTCCQGLVGTQMYAMEINGSGLGFGVSTDAGATAPYPAAQAFISTNTWHHVAGTYDGSTISLYVDGALVASTPHSGAISSNGGFLSIGSEDGRVGACNGCTGVANRYFHGLIDEVTIYGRALSASEIQSIYNVAGAGKCFTASAPTITGFSPSSGGVGTSVVITGSNFIGTSGVSFNGTAAASFTIDSGSQITAVVPSGVTTGPISVTTAGGTATSASPFTFTCAPPPATISAPGSVCGNATNVAASVTATSGATYNWTIGNGVITSGQGTNAITFTPGASGNVSLGITVTNAASCTATGSASVAINPAPSAVITAPPSICTTATGNASVAVQSGATYSWSITNGTITGGAGTNAITFTSGASGNVALAITVTSTAGCSTNGSVSVPINSSPTAAITAPATVCAGASANASVAAQAGATYTWGITNGTITGGAGTSAITFTAGTSGNVALTLTVNNGGCSASSNANVTINAVPTAAIGGPSATCAGSPVTLDAGAGFTSYLWSTGATTQTISVAPVSNTNYSVTVTNASGCSASASHAVTANPLPPSAITAPASICATATGNASVAATAGASYSWSILNGTITGGAGTNAITFTPGASGSVTLAITVTSSVSCSSNSSVAVPINTAPSAAITAPAAVCASKSANASVAAQAGATYSWSITNGTINGGAGTNAIAFTAGTSGNIALSVTVANGGCSAGSNVNIPINAVPSTSISGPAATCAGTPVTLDAGAGFASYLWSTGAATQTITVTPSATTNYSVTVSNGSCTATATHNVTVTPLPSVAINAASSVTSSSTNNGASVPFTSGATYAWTISNGTITGGQGTNAILFTAGASGSVTLGVTATANSCSAANSLSVPIGAQSADVSLSMSATPGSVAEGEGVAYAITVSNSGPGVATNLSLSSTISSATATFVNAAGAGFTCGSPAGMTVTCTAPFLSGGDSVPVTITYSATTGDALLTSAATISAANDSNGGNNSASASVTVTHAPPPPPPPTDGDPCANRGTAPLLTPADQASLGSSAVHFSWSAVANASGYRLWLSIGGAPFVSAGDTSGTSLDVNISSGHVEWYVETLFTGCASTVSPHRTFEVPPKQNCGANAAPSGLAPASDVIAANVTFIWSGVAGATNYEVWAILNGGAATKLGETLLTSLTHHLPPGAIEWFVRALFDGCPATDSAHAQFHYSLPAQCSDAHPSTIAPLNNSANLIAPIDFSWKEANGATSYKVWISRNGAPYSLLATTAATHLDNAAVPSGGTISGIDWYVEALNGGCPSNPSTVSHFSVVNAPSGCPALTAPIVIAPASASAGVQYTVAWQKVGGATAYIVQSADNAAFTNATQAQTSDTQFDTNNVNDGTQPVTRYFRIRALAACQPQPGPFSDTIGVIILPSTTAGNQLQGSVPADQTQIITYTIPLGAPLAGLNFTATPNQPWITVTPASGIVAAGGTSLLVSANTDGLPVGTSLGRITITTSAPASASGARTSASSSTTTTTVSVSLVSPSLPISKSTPPPDALIIPAVAHANGVNSVFQSDVRITNTAAQVMKYQITFTPTGEAGNSDAKQTVLDIEPGKTIALDDVLGTWFTDVTQNVIGVLEVRPLTSQSSTTANKALGAAATAFSTFASSRTYNVTPNGTFGQYIPAIPFANFVGGPKDATASASILSLQQISQSAAFRTNLGFVEGAGEPASLLVSVFGSNGAKVSEFPVQLAAGQHTQFSLASQGVELSDGRVEVKVLSPTGKITAYASVLDNKTNDPLLVSPVNLSANGNTRFVVPGVADLSTGLANWRTDMRIFNASSASVDTTLTFYSQNGGEPKSVTMTLAPNEVKELDGTLAGTFGITNDGGAVHVTTAQPANLIATARTYNQTGSGSYGQFIPAVTSTDATALGARPLQILQLEESNRFRSNVGVLEVSGKPAKIQIAVVPPDGRVTGIAELDLAPNEFRQLNSMLKSFGLDTAYNARVTVKVISGQGRVAAYASVIDQVTQDPTYVPAQ
jgi:fibronectin-binding autotransporter adhesin